MAYEYPLDKPPKIPPVHKLIENGAFPNRVADLYGGELNAPVIGYHYQNGPNQKWVFEPQDATGLRYKIYTVAHQSDNVRAYASNTPKTLYGDVVYGTIRSMVYTVKPVKEGYYTISVEGAGRKLLYWTLDNDEEGTKILLKDGSDNKNGSQWWFFKPA